MSDAPLKTTLLDWWLRYLQLGWPVFPLSPRSKLPLISEKQGGKGCLDATLNEAVVRQWYEQCPQANIGLATGHRFFVLDADVGKGGLESLEYLQQQHGRLPDTIQQITGGGGSQYLFLMPSEFPVRNSANKLAPGIDIRGRGGYIVAPPSIHPETGRRYQWDGLAPIEEQRILPAPDWLLGWLRAEIDKPAQQQQAQPVPNQIGEGNRNATLFRIACSLRRKGFSAEEILATLRITNQQRCQPPLDAKELQTIANSSARYAPDARGNLFTGAAPDSPAEAGELPINPADVEAAVDEAIGRNDLVAAIRLASDVAKVRPMCQAVIKAKLREKFGREFPMRDFERALADATSDGQGQKPPDEPPGAEGETPPGGPDLIGYPLTDSGNGERIVALFGKEIRYCTEMKKWLVWDGKRWAIDELNVMRQKAKLVARLLYAQAATMQDSSRRKIFEKHARASESYAAITAALGQAATEKGIPISALDLDQQPMLLNCLNGVLDLRDGKLLPHNRDFLITKLCPVPYQPDARCPQFLAFIEWAMGGNADADLDVTRVRLIGFVQRALGYGLTADVSEKVVFVFYGEGGNNGKTTLLTLFRDLLGRDYANLLLIETVMAAKQTDATARADLADLRGARFVQTSEVSKEDRLNEQRVKYLTQGMGYIKSRRLYENPLEFEASHKLYMDCNHKPKVTGTDEPIWRRLKLVPFNVTIAEDDKDVDLPEKLRKELPGILAWAVRGTMAWFREGLGEPPEVKEAVSDWREHDDPLKEFIEDHCETGSDLYVTVADLMAGYQWWAKQSGERFPLGRSAFNERLYSKKFKQARRRIESGKLARVWEGLELKGEAMNAIRPVRFDY